MVYPNMDGQGWVGVFLETTMISNSLSVSFSFDLYLQIYPRKFSKESQFSSHNAFDYYHQNYGWRKALSLADYKTAMGRPVVIECVVRPDFTSDTSKERFGYVGLVNEGTTCYLNSLLQTLYHISAFRKAVYLLPTGEDETATIPICLQRVFYSLQVKTQAVSTRELLNSFGWGLEELNTQHDVQEFNCVLSDTLDRKMKGTEVEGTCARLFEGIMTNFIECLNVQYKSTREEKFIDLQLNVKGCADLMDSFRKYLEVEELKGEDMYEAEGYGKQEAKKGISFRHLPPVLQLQLKRFEYDPGTDAMGKVHDSFSFPTTLDLSHFLSDRSHPCQYELLSVLIHAGTTAAGHYFAFIRPELKEWYKFNDETVERVSWEYVKVCGFGGELVSYMVEEGTGVERKGVRNDMSAYMLVYIQKDQISDIVFPMTRTDIPPRLESKFTHEEVLREQVRAMDLRKRQTCNVITLSFDIIRGWDKAGLTPCDTLIYEKIPISRLVNSRFLWNLDKSLSLAAVKRRVEKRLPQGSQCRLWLFTPGYINWKFEPLVYNQTVGFVFDTKSDTLPHALYIEVPDTTRVFHQVPQPNGEIWSFITPKPSISSSDTESSDSTAVLDSESMGVSRPLTVSNSILVFYKWYQFEQGKGNLSLIAGMNVSGEVSAESVRDDIYYQYLEQSRSPSEKVNLYVEKSASPLDTLSPVIISLPADSNTVLSTIHTEGAVFLEPGDVIIGEKVVFPLPYEYKSPVEYLESVLDKGNIRLCYHDKYEYYPFKSFSRELFDTNSVDQEIPVKISLKSTQKQVMERIAGLFQPFIKSITWEQVQLYKYDLIYKRFEELPFPEVTLRQVSFSPKLTEIADAQGRVHFDLTKYSVVKIKAGCLVHVRLTQCLFVDSEGRWIKHYCELLRRGAVCSDLKDAITRRVKDLESLPSTSFTLLAIVLNLRQKAFIEELRDNTPLYDFANSMQNVPSMVLMPDKPTDGKVKNRQKVFCAVWYPDNEPAADPFVMLVSVRDMQRKDSVRDVVRRIVEKSPGPKPKLYEGRTHRNYAREVDLTRGEALQESDDGWVHRYPDCLPVILEVPKPRSSKQALVLHDTAQV